MFSKKYTTLQWIWFWGAISAMFGLLMNPIWPFWTFVVEAIILAFVVGGVIVTLVKQSNRKRNLQKIDVGFYVPSNYPRKPSGQPSLLKELTVGIGTHIVYLIVTTEISVLLNAPDLGFQGDDDNKPSNEGRDYGDMFKRTSTGQIQDWWGNITDPTSNYPRPLSIGQNWPIGIRVKTTGPWCGKLYVQIPVSGETIVHRYLDFIVVVDKDDIPFLKVEGDGIQRPIFGTFEPASTTQITKETSHIHQWEERS